MNEVLFRISLILWHLSDSYLKTGVNLKCYYCIFTS